MIGIRTPFRMSFIGGGSDMKEFYEVHNGCVLSTSIDKYMYTFIHKYFDKKIQIKYSKTEIVESIKDINHPIVRSVLERFDVNGLDVNFIADIPAGTGMGSSSSFTVGLIHALCEYTGQKINLSELAEFACDIEINVLNEPIGKQDQYAAAFGGFNIIRFLSNGEVLVEKLNLNKEIVNQLEQNLVLFYTGKVRSASKILIDQKNQISVSKEKIKTLKIMSELVDETKELLVKGNIDNFGKILDFNWNLKKSLSSKISNDKINQVYETALKNGALGGKILGAGGGGFFLFYCPLENQPRLKSSLSKLTEFPFNFESSGSKLIYNDNK